MTYQRKNLGQDVTFFPAVRHVDARGDVRILPNLDDPRVHKAVIYSADTGIAEVPGNMGINVINLVTDPHLPDIDEWAIFEWDGAYWNLAAPPRIWYGATRHTHHWRLVGRRTELNKQGFIGGQANG